MSKNVLMRATQLVSSLSPQEKLSVINLINSTRNPNSKRSKLLELFDDLNKDSPKKTHHRKLLELLVNRILETLMGDVNLLRNGKYRNNPDILLTLQKESLKLRILHKRGVMKRSFDLAENCLRAAKHTENYDVIIPLLHHQLSMICLYKDHEVYFKKIVEIDNYEECRRMTVNSIRLFQELNMKKYRGITENLDFFVMSSLTELNRLRSKRSLPTMEFVLLFFEKEKAEMEGDVIGSLDKTILLYEKCEAIPECILIFNLFELVYEQARLSFELGRLGESIFLLEKCLDNLPSENTAFQKACELLFLIKYLENQFAYAERILKNLKRSDYYQDHMPVEIKHSWLYYEAALYFSLGQLNRSYRIVNSLKSTALCDLDKLRFKYLRTMILIELEQLDMADKQIESIRKFVARNDLGDWLEKHGLLFFYDCLIGLKYCGYDFGRLPSSFPDLQFKLEQIQLVKIRSGKLSSWLVQYGTWIKRRIKPGVANEDLITWETTRREHYYSCGQVSRIYI